MKTTKAKSPTTWQETLALVRSAWPSILDGSSKLNVPQADVALRAEGMDLRRRAEELSRVNNITTSLLQDDEYVKLTIDKIAAAAAKEQQ